MKQTGLPEMLEVNQTAYRIERLLGRGKGGYSYLAAAPNGHPVVVKQIHHEPCDYYTFGNKMEAELSDYAKLSALGIRMPELLDSNREQERLVKEYVPGDTVYQMVLRDALPPSCLEQVRKMSRILEAAGLNIDFFPTNFILHDALLYYVDYECNGYEEKWNFENWGAGYWEKSPQLIQYAAQHNDLPEA